MATITDLCNQRKQYQLFNKPPIRYNPPNPYPGSTQEQLNMRRKVEILKYNKNSTQGSQLTKAQKLSQMLTRTSNLTRLVCPNDKYIPVLSTASNIPGPPIYLVEDDNVPLYKYAQNTDVYGEQVTDDDNEWTLKTVSNQLILSAQDHTTFCNLIIRPIIKQPYTNFTLQTPVLFRLQGINIPSSANGATITVTLTPTNNTTSNSFLTTYNSNPVSNSNSETQLDNNSIELTLIPPTGSSTYNYFCEAYVGLIKFSNILLNTSPGFVYDFKFNYIIDSTVTNDTINNDIKNNIQFQLYINLDDSYAIQPQQNCNITTVINDLPEKKILFSGSG
tara:strand:+ start:3093 stop:4091 length:999 start_codon:yes stop_codon:yes gene_type:complete